MSEIGDFLLARIAEDDAHVDPTYHHFRNVNGIIESQGEPASCWALLPGKRVCILPVDHVGDQARLRAECEAKRLIVARAQAMVDAIAEGRPHTAFLSGRVHDGAVILSALALSYADHPGYREEWRIDVAMLPA